MRKTFINLSNKINLNNQLSKSINLRLYKQISKSISSSFHNNYSEPNNKEEEIEDVKTWLNTTKPKFLCVYFTNSWNPVCKEGNKLYTNFTRQTGAFTNLKVDTDVYPRLKWYFDSKHEPGFHFYYYGALIGKLGGCNFEKALKEVNRISTYIQNDSEQNSYNINNITYEQPYFKMENDINVWANEEGLDPYQQYKVNFFSGLTALRNMPEEEKWLHSRLKK